MSGRPKNARRDACDQCHALKTRCVTLNGSQPCRRCARLQLGCKYGPRLRIGRPPRQRKPSSDPSVTLEDQKAQTRSPVAVQDTINVAGSTVQLNCPAEQSAVDNASISDNVLFDDQFVWYTSSASLDGPSDSGSGVMSPNYLSTSKSSNPYFPTPIDDATDITEDRSFLPSFPLINCEAGVQKFQPVHESNDATWRLFDLQQRLVGLSECLLIHTTPTHGNSGAQPEVNSSSLYAKSQFSKDMESAYQATEDMVEIANNLHIPKSLEDDSLDSGQATGSIPLENAIPNLSTFKSTCSSIQPPLSCVLLFVGCYARLTEIYTILAVYLHNYQRHNINDWDKDGFNVRNSAILPQSVLPSLQLGTTRIVIPHDMGTKLHHQILTFMVQKLRRAMHQFISNQQADMSCESLLLGSTWSDFENTSMAVLISKKVLGEMSKIEERSLAIFQEDK